MHTILGRVGHGAAALAWIAAVAAVVAINAPETPHTDNATGHRCHVAGCLYEPGSDALARARALDRVLARLGVIEPDDPAGN